jgi:phage terminase small subunit
VKDADGLTPKQRRFVEEYLVDLNATGAARRAGYSIKTAEAIGMENLRKPRIRECIDAAMAARAAETAITAEYVLTSIKRIAESAESADDLAAALKGHELLGKHLRLFTDKIEHSGKVEHVEIIVK